MNRKAMFSTGKGEWETPRELFTVLDGVCNFDIDVCASEENAKCTKYWSREENALNMVWMGKCWMNPPYGRGIGRWMRKAYTESKNLALLVVCLVPARTDTAWWHNYVLKGERIFFRGRLKFGGQKTGAPFPSALVIYGRGRKEMRGVLCKALRAAGWRCA